VTIARTFTASFSGISLKSWTGYFAGQFLGLGLGLPFAEYTFGKKSFQSSLAIFCTSNHDNANKGLQEKNLDMLIERIEEIKNIIAELNLNKNLFNHNKESIQNNE